MFACLLTRLMELTSNPVMTGKGLTGVWMQARPSLKVNSTVSTPMMVQQDPSFSTTLLGSLTLDGAWREREDVGDV